LTALILLVALGGLMHAARSFAPAGAELTQLLGTDLAFGFLLLAAYFGGKLVAMARSPQLTGYILVGVAAGPFVLDLVSTDMVGSLKIVNGVAVCLIALTAGAELSLKKMKPLMKTVTSMMFWAVVGTTLLLTATIFAIRPMLPFFAELSTTQSLLVCVMLAVTLASQSPAVVMALINETKSDGPVSQTTLALVVIADLLVIVLYALASSGVTAVSGGGVDVMQTVKTVSWELGGSAGIGLFIGILLALFLKHVEHGASLFVVLVCFVVAEVGVAIHLDPLIVTLTAGVYLENVSRVDCHKLIHDLESASLPVYLVFFALAGAGLQLDLVYMVLAPAVIVAVVRAIGFYAGCRVAAKRSKATPMVAKWTWIGLLPQAGLALALALLMDRAFPAFGTEAAALVLGVVGINQEITPIALRFALIAAGEAGKKSGHDFGHGDDDVSHDTEPHPAPVVTAPLPDAE
jgi:Kef-type K+ transport system membrane component KefB